MNTFTRLLAWTLLLGLSGCIPARAVTVREMMSDIRYWPPACSTEVCVLTGQGGLVHTWTRHVDKHVARGRKFVVKGTCASACEIAARRAGAKALPGARLIPHTPGPAEWR